MSNQRVIRPVGVGILPKGGVYTVSDLGSTMAGYTDSLKKELGVCRSETSLTRMVQLHELGHVMYSDDVTNIVEAEYPNPNNGPSQFLVNAAEDARIQVLLTQAIPNWADGVKEEDIDGVSLEHALPGYVSTWYGSPVVRKLIVERFRPLPSALKEFEEMDILCRTLTDRGDLSIKGFTLPLLQALHAWAKVAGRAAKLSTDTSCRGGVVLSGHGMASWTVPTVSPIGAYRRSVRLGAAARRAAEDGPHVRDISRLASDGRIFSRVRRSPGALQRGSVLIDCSSSMKISPELLDAVLQKMPFATVLGYSGDQVYILAHRGNRVSSLPRWPGTNECDGPALLILSRLQKPRIWVCDGYVTGVDDRPHSRLSDEASAIVSTARIFHVHNLEVFATWLMGGADLRRIPAQGQVK